MVLMVREDAAMTKEQVPLTKKRFERLLEKVFTTRVPRKSKESGSEASETSAVHPSDDCSETHTSLDKIEGTSE